MPNFRMYVRCVSKNDQEPILFINEEALSPVHLGIGDDPVDDTVVWALSEEDFIRQILDTFPWYFKPSKVIDTYYYIQRNNDKLVPYYPEVEPDKAKFTHIFVSPINGRSYLVQDVSDHPYLEGNKKGRYFPLDANTDPSDVNDEDLLDGLFGDECIVGVIND